MNRFSGNLCLRPRPDTRYRWNLSVWGPYDFEGLYSYHQTWPLPRLSDVSPRCSGFSRQDRLAPGTPCPAFPVTSGGTSCLSEPRSAAFTWSRRPRRSARAGVNRMGRRIYHPVERQKTLNPINRPRLGILTQTSSISDPKRPFSAKSLDVSYADKADLQQMSAFEYLLINNYSF